MSDRLQLPLLERRGAQELRWGSGRSTAVSVAVSVAVAAWARPFSVGGTV
ncbi:MAG: hypothetical protein IPL28_27250 [Chloroflexi bacterium]|nr:hypothetical protein [Chloroflexota bacterium]